MNGRKVYGVKCSKCGHPVPVSKSEGKPIRIGGKRGPVLTPQFTATCSWCLGKKRPTAEL